MAPFPPAFTDRSTVPCPVFAYLPSYAMPIFGLFCRNLFSMTCIVAMLSIGGALAAEPERKIDFSRDVLPILSDRCFHCHGPDVADRQADLRLDRFEDATADRDGHPAIVAGSLDRSELLNRVTSSDPDLVMPPPDSHRKPLGDDEVALLRRWIESGAAWGKHWAFEPPRKVSLGPPTADEVNDNPIDVLVRRELLLRGLDLSPEASKETLLRRLSLDLTGLPPSPQELDAFLNDHAPDAYARAVDRLLSSPHHGERLAMWWLDAARYSDTDGFQGDATRTNWPWRDWVVQAFNDNLPFDRFTIEQFAGDLLPGATPDQILATCFHRNHMTNGEGGRDPEESRIDYVIDRVNTMGTVWLGMTLGCVQCHAHKFDPISHEDYYRLFAFFNGIDEDGKAGGGAKPFLKYRSDHAAGAVAEAQVWAELQTARQAATNRRVMADYPAWFAKQVELVAGGFSPWRVGESRGVRSVEGTEMFASSDGVYFTGGPYPRQDDYRLTLYPGDAPVTALRLEVLADPGHADGKYSRGEGGNYILTDVKLQLRRRGDSQLRDIDIETAIASVEQEAKGRNYGNIKDTLDDDPRNGWTLPADVGDRKPVAIFVLAQPLRVAADEEVVFTMLHRSTDGFANIGKFRVTMTDQEGPAIRSLEPMPLERLAEIVANATKSVANATTDVADATSAATPDPALIEGAIDEGLKGRLVEQFLQGRGDYQADKSRADAARRHLEQAKSAAGELAVMVLGERAESRPTHVLLRGEWDRHGERVKRGFPAAILPAVQPQKENAVETSDAAAQVPSDATAPQVPSDATAQSSAGAVAAQVPSDASEQLTRLDLARWIVSPQNPLTARVVTNHLWQLMFGSGLVRTPQDFGLQGDRPTHPELLDWLAVELVESGWDIRHLIRLMVTSRTYRQTSDAAPAAIAADPDNRLLARGPRYRLASWMIRDAALQASGLLNTSIGGPTVYMPQPAGVWEEIFMGRYSYQTSPGPARYRRTLYTFWRRSSAPTFLFDAAQRRVCEVQTLRTNTPLQALTLLNDSGMLEAAVTLARDAVDREPNHRDRLITLFRRITSRSPSADECLVLDAIWSRAASHYSQSPADAIALFECGQADPPPQGVAVAVAPYAIVASSIFNLDEAMTHE